VNEYSDDFDYGESIPEHPTQELDSEYSEIQDMSSMISESETSKNKKIKNILKSMDTGQLEEFTKRLSRN